jgi:hypothetical protein
MRFVNALITCHHNHKSVQQRSTATTAIPQYKWLTPDFDDFVIDDDEEEAKIGEVIPETVWTSGRRRQACDF